MICGFNRRLWILFHVVEFQNQPQEMNTYFITFESMNIANFSVELFLRVNERI